MPTVNTLLGFSAAALVLLLLPGPAVIYILTRSASQGKKAGLVSVAGIHLGTLVHIAAAMIGLSAVLATSAAAFATVKLLGAAYLIWLGIQSLLRFRRGASQLVAPTPPNRALREVFFDGFVLNVLNPKTAIFFLSFVPQFVNPEAVSAALQVAVLGAVFIALGVLSDGAYALAGGWLGSRRRPGTRQRPRTDLVAGTVYIGLGLTTAISPNQS